MRKVFPKNIGTARAEKGIKRMRKMFVQKLFTFLFAFILII